MLNQASLKVMNKTILFFRLVEEVVKESCKMRINLDILFTKDDSSGCDTCKFCEGSSKKALYNPNIENVCIECTSIPILA